MRIVVMPPTDPDIPKLDPKTQHAIVAAFLANLTLRPDAEQVRMVLANALLEHIGDVCPEGRDAGSPAWLRSNVDSVLATFERLYAVALEYHPSTAEFFDRMAWLPKLLQRLDQPVPLDG
jgi:hypothetical protein